MTERHLWYIPVRLRRRLVDVISFSDIVDRQLAARRHATNMSCAGFAVGLLVGPASTIAKAFEKLAKAVDQQKDRIWPDGYWTWLQQSAGG
jgi:hypothetical protein